MKQLIAFLLVLLIIASALYFELDEINSRGKLCESPLASAYYVANGVITDIISYLTPEQPEYADYTVTVVDGIGNPVSDVMVKFINSHGESKTRVTDKGGLAVLKNALVSNYQVVLEQGFSDAVIEQANYFLSKDVRNIKVVVRDTSKTYEIYGEVPDDTYAYNVGATSYTIPCFEGQTTYYVFYAQIAGTYKVTVSSEDSEMIIGYYGIPMFVQSTHRGEGEYNGKSFELIVQDTATPYVLGITATKNVDALLTIERTGDAPFDPQFAPWTTVPATAELEKITLTEGTTLTDISITDPSVSVTLGDDGYYYTADGKLVYLRINSVSAAKYLDVSIAFIAGLVDSNFGQNFGGYVFDDDGNFVGKYSYNEMLASYYENCDVSGVYPLTAELAEAIKVHGESTGWWNPNTPNYLFNGVPVVTDNAWLFLCCTAN